MKVSFGGVRFQAHYGDIDSGIDLIVWEEAGSVDCAVQVNKETDADQFILTVLYRSKLHLLGDGEIFLTHQSVQPLARGIYVAMTKHLDVPLIDVKSIKVELVKTQSTQEFKL